MNAKYLLLLAVVSIVLVYGLTFLHRLRPILIYSLPAINALAAVLVLGDRAADGVHLGFLRFLLMIALIVLMLPRFRMNAVTSTILIYVIYLLLLIPTAMEPQRSLEGVLKPAVSLLMLPVAYVYFRRPDQLPKLQLSMMVAVVILMLNFGLAQVFGFGASPYADDINVGEGAVTMAYLFAYALLMTPLTLRLMPRDRRLSRAALGLLMFSALIAMFLIFRRGALLGFGCGLAVYTLLSPGRRSVRLLKFGAVGAMLFFISSPYYLDKVQRLAVERGDIAAFVSNTERGRMAEFGIIGERLMEGSLTNALFGEEPFNSRRWMGAGRSLHVDYMNLLYGTGIVGLMLYLGIYALAAWTLYQRARHSRLPLAREMRDTGLALIMASLVISFSTQIYMISSLAFVFFYVGGLLGILTAPPQAARSRRVPAVRQAEAAGYA